jgi:hypothetical protein
MTTPPLNPLSFQRAAYEGDPPPPDQCAYCGRGITNEYFRVGGHLACPVCAQQAQSLVPPNAHSVFLRSLSYRAVAAVLGCIGYALIVIITGWSIGYAAIGVGYLVGWAMRRGAKEHGGRRYQVAAALLTYAAVAVAFVPIALHQIGEKNAKQAQVSQQTTVTPQDPQTASPPQTTSSQPHGIHWGKFFLSIALLLGLGLISPFLELTGSIGGGLLNLFIILFGVRFAWQMMAVKTVTVDGPFEAVTPPGR